MNTLLYLMFYHQLNKFTEHVLNLYICALQPQLEKQILNKQIKLQKQKQSITFYKMITCARIRVNLQSYKRVSTHCF